ncbi:unnamed protein product [Acanthoscelides obtectus]|uniref:Uncharacterized protein n=1 Tax=Acanthoscelides obtectus TaxID=200917 RepID=A0A9P0NVQ6_ACAOB|nr:unnamed protein product [Acanthoscelides obtectus]CAK1640683.1 hypothetical protein AOBTE_LOCUS11874 [Acanthoscelides obtectus]
MNPRTLFVHQGTKLCFGSIKLYKIVASPSSGNLQASRQRGSRW